MSNEIRIVVADEAENFLGWRVERVGGAIRCRVWVLRSADESAETSISELHVPDTEPAFEEMLRTEQDAIEYLAGDDVFLHTTARELMRQL